MKLITRKVFHFTLQTMKALNMHIAVVVMAFISSDLLYSQVSYARISKVQEITLDKHISIVKHFKGESYLCLDQQNATIWLLDASTGQKTPIGSYGAEKGKFALPLEPVVFDGSDILVNDNRKKEFLLFNQRGKVLAVFKDFIPSISYAKAWDRNFLAVPPFQNPRYGAKKACAYLISDSGEIIIEYHLPEEIDDAKYAHAMSINKAFYHDQYVYVLFDSEFLLAKFHRGGEYIALIPVAMPGAELTVNSDDAYWDSGGVMRPKVLSRIAIPSFADGHFFVPRSNNDGQLKYLYEFSLEGDLVRTLKSESVMKFPIAYKKNDSLECVYVSHNKEYDSTTIHICSVEK